jgi:hypothetical protein
MKIFTALVLSALVLCHCDARAFDLSQETLTAAMGDAMRLSGYSLPDPAPPMQIVLVAPGRINDITGCQSCGAGALYLPDEYAPGGYHQLMVDSGVFELPPGEAHSLLVHELTHYLQWTNGTTWRTCRERLAVEQEAMDVQDRSRIEHGLPEMGRKSTRRLIAGCTEA